MTCELPKDGLVASGASHVVQTWSFQPRPDMGKERQWRLSSVTSDAIKHAYVMDLPSKLRRMDLENFQVREPRLLSVYHTMLDPKLPQGQESLCLEPSSYMCLHPGY